MTYNTILVSKEGCINRYLPTNTLLLPMAHIHRHFYYYYSVFVNVATHFQELRHLSTEGHPIYSTMGNFGVEHSLSDSVIFMLENQNHFLTLKLGN